MTTDEETAAHRAAWLANDPEGSATAASRAPAPHLVVLALAVVWLALGVGMSAIGVILDLLASDSDSGGAGVSVAGLRLGEPPWAIVVAPLAGVTLVTAWRFLGGAPARPLLVSVLAWLPLVLVLDEPWDTRLVAALVLLVVAGALLHAVRRAERDRPARET